MVPARARRPRLARVPAPSRRGGREIDGDFADGHARADPRFGCRRAVAGGRPIASVVREYGDFAAQLPEGMTLIVDDHHAIDGSAETDRILRGLIDRTGNGFSIVLASRSAPRLPLGAAAVRAAPCRLDGADLGSTSPRRTGCSARPTSGRSIPTSSTADRRTEGWAALLMLVRRASRTRPPPRPVPSSHSSVARGDLYDFLAEEVIATLATDLHAFLTRVSILTRVDVASAGLVCEMDTTEILQAIREAEGLALLAGPDRGAGIGFIRWCGRSSSPSSKPRLARMPSARSTNESGGLWRRPTGRPQLGTYARRATQLRRPKSLTTRSTRYLPQANSNERDRSLTAPLEASIEPVH